MIPWTDFVGVWFQVASLSFGGPAAQIAVIHRIVVDQKKWIDEQRFLHALNYCMLLPGPEACELAIYIGWLMRGIPGGLVAGVLFVLPGFVSLLAISIVYAVYQQAPLVQAIFFGLQAAILAVILEAVVRIARRVIKNGAMLAIAVCAFIAIFFFRVPFPLIILAAAAIGLVGGWLRPSWFYVIRGQKEAQPQGVHAIDYNAPHTQPDWRRALVIASAGIALWAGPLIALRATLGRDHVFTQQGLFFSKVSLVTFGGAYAVLPYVATEAEEKYGWVNHTEMMAGLGLAESTPGPLIQVVQFVGFLGAYKNPGDLHPIMAGIIGSLIINWVTYLPCFLWVFLGGPYVERLRGNQALGSAMSAITAAVVGVILNLAIWFAMKAMFGELHDLAWGPFRIHWPRDPHFSWATCLLFALSLVALFGFHRKIYEVLGVSVMLGATLWMFGAR